MYIYICTRRDIMFTEYIDFLRDVIVMLFVIIS